MSRNAYSIPLGKNGGTLLSLCVNRKGNVFDQICQVETYNGRRMNMIQVFFHNGAKHHRVGLVSADHMPPSPHFPVILASPRLGLAISDMSKPSMSRVEIQGSVKCPICDRALPFLCAAPTLGNPFA